ncbi:MAG: outer membrane lipoprotein-sorting protein [Acidobacteria bacterium]|nr:outer membrane lipoprotein-sorting protein [Acidobacteriota bacterium]
MKHTHRIQHLFTAALVLAATLRPVPARAADDPRQIVEESDRRSNAKSQRYEGILEVVDSNGKTTEKRWAFMRLGSHGTSKTIIRFTTPADVKGVALLVVSHPDRASDQWMWTPAIERDRRIALQDRSTRFFGTDFSFEDLEERDVNQYDYSLVGDEAVDGAACWKIQASPKQAKSSQYSRSVLWIRKDHYTMARIESYVKDTLARRLEYSDVREVDGFWTAHRLSMSDVRRKSLTRLTLSKVTYNVPLTEDAFTVQALRRQ